MKKSIFIFIFLATLIVACKKSHPTINISADFTKGYNLYISGTLAGNAVYWKNGNAIFLDSFATATGITVSDTDVYVCGYLNRGSDSYAVYWKNGKRFQLTNSGKAYLNAIAVVGTDVYCAGGYQLNASSNQYKAAYWKNADVTMLSPEINAVVFCIAASGSNIYIGGEKITNNIDTPMVWKNAVPYFYASPGYVTSIAFSPTDTILAGISGKSPAYFSLTNVQSLAANGIALCAYSNGPDTYIGGSINDSLGHSQAVYWKNGNAVMLKSNFTSSLLTGISFAGSDLYASGACSSPGSIPAVWKNGTFIKLGDNGTTSWICAAPVQ